MEVSTKGWLRFPGGKVTIAGVSVELPVQVPSEIACKLEQDPPPGNAVPLITIDGRGFPHTALVSYAELIYLDSTLYVFMAAGSRSSRFLRQRRRCTLLFIHRQFVHHLKAEAHWLGDYRSHGVHRLDLKSVLKDSPPAEEAGAVLQSGIRFTGQPSCLARSRRFKRELRELLQQHAGKLPEGD